MACSRWIDACRLAGSNSFARYAALAANSRSCGSCSTSAPPASRSQRERVVPAEPVLGASPDRPGRRSSISVADDRDARGVGQREVERLGVFGRRLVSQRHHAAWSPARPDPPPGRASSKGRPRPASSDGENRLASRCFSWFALLSRKLLKIRDRSASARVRASSSIAAIRANGENCGCPVL